MIKYITLASKTYNTTLDSVIRVPMYDFIENSSRRISVLPGISGGIVQDYGFHDIDRTFSGTLLVTVAQAEIIKNMKENSLTTWYFGVDSDLYEIHIQAANESDKIGNKVNIDVVFQVVDKVV